MKHVIRIMGMSGDTRVEFDPQVQTEVESASQQFERMVRQGYTAFATEPGGAKRELISEFDPNIETILMVPRIVGG